MLFGVGNIDLLVSQLATCSWQMAELFPKKVFFTHNSRKIFNDKRDSS